MRPIGPHKTRASKNPRRPTDPRNVLSRVVNPRWDADWAPDELWLQSTTILKHRKSRVELEITKGICAAIPLINGKVQLFDTIPHGNAMHGFAMSQQSLSQSSYGCPRGDSCMLPESIPVNSL